MNDDEGNRPGPKSTNRSVAQCADCDERLAVDDAGGLVCPTTRLCAECGIELDHANAFACPCDLGNCPYCGDQSTGTDYHCTHFLWSSGDYPEDLGILDEDELDEDELDEDEPEAGILQWRWSDAELDAALGPARPLFTDLVQIGSVPEHGMSRSLFGSTLLCLVSAPMT